MANKRMLRTAVTMAVAVVVLVALWEGYKWVGDQTGGTWPGTTVDLPVTSNDITMPHVADIAGELGEVIAGTKPGRNSDDAITVFKSVGVAYQDIATAAYVYRKAVDRGMGEEIDLKG